MRVAMFAHSVSIFTHYFARYFLTRGDVVKVISFSPNAISGVDVEFVGIEPFDGRTNKHVYVSRVPRVRTVLRAFRPDIVYAIYLASNGLTAALSWSGPLVVSAIGSDVLAHGSQTGIRRRFREGVIRFVSGRADLINTVSLGLDQELLRLGVPAEKLIRIPFGTDTERFHPAGDQPRRSASRMICTRSHEPIYDIGTILAALARLKDTGLDFHCTFTAGGSLLESHKHQARELGLQELTTFTGPLEHGMLPQLLRSSDVYISASLGDGTSVSLLEAMATGLCPVVSSIPANQPWVENGRTGLLFAPRSAEELARALALALQDTELRRRAFEVNRARVETQAGMKANMDRLAGQFDRLVSEAPRRWFRRP